MRELRAIVRAGYHPYILQLTEVHRTTSGKSSQQQHSLHLVLEYMPDGSLQDYLNQQQQKLYNNNNSNNNVLPLSDAFVRRTLAQVLSALQHLHSVGWMHRDVKPDNLLLRGDVCKLADFSLARPILLSKTSNQNNNNPPSAYNNNSNNMDDCGVVLTDYVSTRWYRAPELILQADDYGPAVDLFALGCIAAGELSKLRPLFPGENLADQLHRTLCLLGTPRSVGWGPGVALMQRMGLVEPRLSHETGRAALRDWLRQVSGEGVQLQPSPNDSFVDLVSGMLALNPQQRLTAERALLHPYFAGFVLNHRGTKNAAATKDVPSPPTTTMTTTTTTPPPARSVQHGNAPAVTVSAQRYSCHENNLEDGRATPISQRAPSRDNHDVAHTRQALYSSSFMNQRRAQLNHGGSVSSKTHSSSSDGENSVSATPRSGHSPSSVAVSSMSSSSLSSSWSVENPYNKGSKLSL